MNELNKRYTFDNFVVGNSNKLAHDSALAVAKTLAIPYNLLFLYGGVGLGKTHLMQAIGNKIIQDNPKVKVLYVTSEIFMNQLINSNHKYYKVIDKYINIDIFLIDDIHLIAKSNIAQEAFTIILNSLYEHEKQIIISSDRSAKDIHIEERLKSRFEWGIIADIIKPNYETRLEILKRKRQLDNIIIDDEMLSIIATKVDSNIRELEEVLNKIVAFASLNHSPITMEITEKVINDTILQDMKN